jgi:hypothetical protein
MKIKPYIDPQGRVWKQYMVEWGGCEGWFTARKVRPSVLPSRVSPDFRNLRYFVRACCCVRSIQAGGDP